MKGFSLIELLIVISIIGIVTAIAFPVYTHYLVRAKRYEAEVALSKLSVALEQYHMLNNSYKDANLEKLHVSILKNYKIAIDQADDTEFMISAHPQLAQAEKDFQCSTLTLKSNSEKGITGPGTIEECW